MGSSDLRRVMRNVFVSHGRDQAASSGLGTGPPPGSIESGDKVLPHYGTVVTERILPSLPFESATGLLIGPRPIV